MKAKYILLSMLFIGFTYNAEAQFLKKLKKQAEQAAERTVLKKTDEIVTQKTEKTIDDVADGNDSKSAPETEPSSNEKAPIATSQGNASSSSMISPKNRDTPKLPESYDFDWEFKTEIKTTKEDPLEMNYLINSHSKDYFGMEMSSEELKGQGTMRIVTDTNQKTMNMFMDMNGQKMVQISKISEQKAGKEDSKFSFKEIGTKTILGYTCYGMQVENADYIADVYFTLDAPVNFSAFFAFANNKKGPKGFDPALLQVLEEDALLMEMSGTDKKKKNQSFTMTAISLEKKDTTIKTGGYQAMPGF